MGSNQSNTSGPRRVALAGGTLLWVGPAMIEGLEAGSLMAADPTIVAYQGRANQVLDANVVTLQNWATTNAAVSDNASTSGISIWTVAAAYARSVGNATLLATAHKAAASLMEDRVVALYGGGNDGWPAWATADTYLRYRSLIDADTGRYAPTGFAANANGGDGKYSLTDLFKYVLTQSYYAPIDSTSNHYLENATACYLANQAFPGEVVKNFNNSASDPTGAVLIYGRAQSIPTKGPGEYLSINYGGANWAEFLSVYQLTKLPANAAVAQAAKLAFETALAFNAAYWMNGQVAGPTARGYPNTGAWGASNGDTLTWTYLGRDYGQAAQQLAYATSTNVKAFAVLASEAGLTQTFASAPPAYFPPASVLSIDSSPTPIVVKSNFGSDFQCAYDAGQWSTYSDGHNWNAQGGAGAGWRNRTIWTKPENQNYQAVAWAINPDTSATVDANGNWSYVDPETLAVYPTTGMGSIGGGSPFSSQVQNKGTVLQGFNIPPRSAGLTPGGAYVVRGGLIYLPIPKVTATGLQAADGDGWMKPVLRADGRRLYVAYNSVFICFVSTAPISLGTKEPFAQYYNIFGGTVPGQTVDPETYLQFAVAQETFSPTQFAGTTLAEQFTNFQTVMGGRAMPIKTNGSVDHPAWQYTDAAVTLTTQFGSPARYARDAKKYTRGFGDDFIGDVTNSNPQVIDYTKWPMFEVSNAAGQTLVSIASVGDSMTVTTPGQTPTYYNYTTWQVSTASDIGLKISSPAGGQIRLDWKAGLGASSFKIERSSDGTAWSTVTSTLAGTSTSYTDVSLAQKSIYYYRVTPNGTALGTSYPVSAAVSYNPPTNLRLTLDSINQVTLSWTNNAASNDGVQIQYSVDGYNQWTFLQNRLATDTSRPFSFTDFTGGERVFFRAVAYSNDGPNATMLYSTPSNVVGTEFSTALVNGTTSMPRFLKAAANAPGSQIALSWDDTAYNETAYRVERSNDNGATWAVLTSTLPANTVGYVDTNPAPGQTYRYRVAAVNGTASSAYSLMATGKAMVDNLAPTVAQAAAGGSTMVTGRSTSVRVLGSDDAGEAGLRYFWQVTSGPGGVTFADNYANGSKNTTATFSRAGDYLLTATIVDVQGLRTTSSVAVTVKQTVSSIALTPASKAIRVGTTAQLTATQADQFGMPMLVQGTLTWQTTAGSVSSSGLFAAPAAPCLAVVSVSSGATSAAAEITCQSQAVPLAWYRFEEGSGATATDYTGNGYDATLSSNAAFGAGATIKGRTTGGLTLAGNGYALIGDPAALQITGAITLAAWVKPTTMTGTQSIVEKGYNASGTRGELFLRINGGKYEIGSWNGTNNYTSVTMPTGDVGTWVHLLGTYDAAAGRWVLYRNGVQISASNSATGAVLVTGRSWTIGSTNVPDRYFSGSIDDVRIYNSTLSATDAAAVYRSFLQPTVATPAAATPVVAGKSTLSVLGASDTGEASLTYTWSLISAPVGTVMFSANGTNASKSTVASFSANGIYRLLVTVTDSTGQAVTSQVDVTVALPTWVDPTSVALWDPLQQSLTLSGVTRIVGDPGTEWPTIIANGASSVLELQPGPSGRIHLGALRLGGGASATLRIVSSVSTSGGSVLILGNSDSANAAMQIDGSSSLDLQNNDLIVRPSTSTSALSTVRAAIVSGLAGGAWNGPGLRSSSAALMTKQYALGWADAADLAYSSFDGEPVAAGTTLVKYTRRGDATLDGVVTFNDFLRLQNGFGKATGWSNGDFNFDGLADFNDFLELQNNFVRCRASTACCSEYPLGSRRI